MIGSSKKRVIAVLLIAVMVSALGLVASALGAANDSEIHENSRLYPSELCQSCHDTLGTVGAIGGWWDAHRRHFVTVFLEFVRNDAGVGSYGCAKCHRETTLPTYFEGDLSFTKSDAANEAWRHVRPGVCVDCHGKFSASMHRFSGVERDFIAERVDCTICHRPGGIGLDPMMAHGSAVLESSTSVDPAAAGIWWINQPYANARDFCPRCHGALAWFDVEETNPGIGCSYDLCHGTSTETQATGSHQMHFGSEKGPELLDCDLCHGVGSSRGEHAGHRNDIINFADGDTLNMTATSSCDNCHSPDGPFDGVDTTAGSVGAKDNWLVGVYDTSAALSAGKGGWCDGCHDSYPSVIGARSAPAVAGDDTGYGFYVSGHGLASGSDYDKNAIADGQGNDGASAGCPDCHDLRKQHINGVDDTTFDGHRLSATVNGTATSSSAATCDACHRNVLGSLAATRQVSNHGNYPGGGYPKIEPDLFVVECPACHEVHGNNESSGTRNLKMVRASINSAAIAFRRTSGPDSFDEDSGDPSDTDDICVTCHITSVNNPGYPTTSHAGGLHPAGDQRGQNCTQCHEHDYGSDADVVPDDGFMPSDCGSCHSFPPGTDQGTYEGTKTHIVHAATYGFECGVCHADFPVGHNESGVTGAADWSSSFDPANIDMGFDAAINPDGTSSVILTGPDRNRQCADLYCHGQSGTLSGDDITLFGGTNASTTPNIPTWDDPDSTNTGVFSITKATGDCGTCHDTLRDNASLIGDTGWPTWDTTAPFANDWSTTPAVAWDVTPNSSIGDAFQAEFGWQAYQTHLDQIRGPQLTCEPCHYAPPTIGGGSTATPNTHVNQQLDFSDDTTDQADTSICGDLCHSTGGEFDGADDPIIGAKNNWPFGVFDATTTLLRPGKENWCLGCHDSAQKQIPGVGSPPPNIAGDDLVYGYNINGHGLSTSDTYDADSIADLLGNVGAGKQCLVCHDDQTRHLNGQDDTTTAGQRLRSTINSTSTTDVFSICRACHQETGGPDSALKQVSTHGNDTASGYVPVEADFRIECQVCHEPHGLNENINGLRNLKMIRDSFNSTDVVFTATSGNDSFDENSTDTSDADDLCVTCHITSVNNPGYPTTNHAGGDHGAVDRRGSDCAGCHKHDYDADGIVEPYDAFMPGDDCDTCHGFPPAPATESYALSGGAHEVHNDNGYSCSTCHGHDGSGPAHGGSVGRSIVLRSNVDTVFNGAVSFPGGTTMDNGLEATETYNLVTGPECYVGCHNPIPFEPIAETPDLFNLAGWNDATVTPGVDLACKNCHDSQAGAIDETTVTGVGYRSSHSIDTSIREDCLACHNHSQHTLGDVRLASNDDTSIYTWDASDTASAEPACLSCHDSDGNQPFSTTDTPRNVESRWAEAAHQDGGGSPAKVVSCLGNGTSGCHGNAHGSAKLSLLGPSNVAPTYDTTRGSTEEEGFCFNCHDDPANSERGVNILQRFTAGSTSTVRYATSSPTVPWRARHDLLDSDQATTGAKIECLDCHNPHADGRLRKTSDPDDIWSSVSETETDWQKYPQVVVQLRGPLQTLTERDDYNWDKVENGQDAWVDQARPDFNVETSGTVLERTTNMARGYSGSPTAVRSTYVQFDDLSDIPDGAVITTATLELSANPNAGSGSLTRMSARRVLDSWSESSITWNTSPTVSASAEATTGTWLAENLYSSPWADMLDKYYFRWDITSLVQGWKNGTIDNYGVAIVPEPDGGGSYADDTVYGWSREGTMTAVYSGTPFPGSTDPPTDNRSSRYWPRLVVSYTMTSPPERVTPNAFCARCHDGSPPPGVTFPVGVRQIEPTFTVQPHGEGQRAGDPYPSPTLFGPQKGNKRGQSTNPGLACVNCHDAHGSANWATLRDDLNGITGRSAQVRNAGSDGDTEPDDPNPGFAAWCSNCHTRSMEGMPGGSPADSCWDCHTNHSGDNF